MLKYFMFILRGDFFCLMYWFVFCIVGLKLKKIIKCCIIIFIDLLRVLKVESFYYDVN